jgi:hypothetical protein
LGLTNLDIGFVYWRLLVRSDPAWALPIHMDCVTKDIILGSLTIWYWSHIAAILPHHNGKFWILWLSPIEVTGGHITPSQWKVLGSWLSSIEITHGHITPSQWKVLGSLTIYPLKSLVAILPHHNGKFWVLWLYSIEVTGGHITPSQWRVMDFFTIFHWSHMAAILPHHNVKVWILKTSSGLTDHPHWSPMAAILPLSHSKTTLVALAISQTSHMAALSSLTSTIVMGHHNGPRLDMG